MARQRPQCPSLWVCIAVSIRNRLDYLKAKGFRVAEYTERVENAIFVPVRQKNGGKN